MADKKLNELGTIESFDNAYVELSQNQYRISKTNLGKQLTNEVHTNFSVASSNPAYIYAQKSDGTNFRISKSDLTKAIINENPVFINGAQPGNRALYDGCFIMYHQQDDGGPEVAPYSAWTDLQDNGEEADGVLIVEGGHSLVIAPHEKYCRWSSKTGTATDTVSYTSENRIALLNVWDGKKRTAIICTDKSKPFWTDGPQYAPGYCYNYTPHVASDGGVKKKGLSAGKYWLPCVAELMMIYTHKYRINAGLALIDGANQLSDNWYWSSTECSATSAWNLSFGGAYLHWGGKVSDSLKVRPVSAFFHEGY